MDSNKIGIFIKQLRSDNSMSQTELAKQVHVGREAVSKWERGITIPDSANMISLSDLFNVSIDELMYGEYKTEENKEAVENIRMEIYDDRNATNIKLKNTSKKLLIAIILLFVGILSFLIYYFFYTYDSVKIYTIESKKDDISLSDGLLIITPENIYFRLGIINGIDEEEISKVALYYDNNGEKKFIYQDSSPKDYIIRDYIGYNEYFEIKDKDVVFDCLYLDIYLKDAIKTLKLNKTEDYSNRTLTFPKREKISDGAEAQITEKVDNELIRKIKKQFSCEDDCDIYTHKIVVNKKSYELYYIDDTYNLLIEWQEEKDIYNSIEYDTINKNFIYHKSDSDLNYIDECLYEGNNQSNNTCNDSIMKLINTIIKSIEDGRA